MKEKTKKGRILQLEEPVFFHVSLLQHIGQESEVRVKAGDYIKRYQLIGEASGSLSSKIHSPVSGRVKEIREKRLPNGILAKEAVIENDFLYTEESTTKREIKNLESFSAKELLEIIKEAGITGEGGAQFPTGIKYDVKGKKINYFILNGAECEPYLTCDYALMKEYATELFNGIKIAAKIFMPENIILAIDEKYSDLKNEFLKYNTDNIEIAEVSDIYPQGSEQLLINSLLNKEIPKSKLPFEEGVIVSNVGTVKAVYDAFVHGRPLVERVVTISGEKSGIYGNYTVKVGTPVSHITEKSVLKDKAENIRTIFGGPMMGNEINDTESGITKGTSGVLFLSKKIDKTERKNCILCGYCSEVCPMYLMPMRFEEYYRKGKYKKLEKFELKSCIECGACEYICPSRVPLIESIKSGKKELNRQKGGEK
jgi:electron transport complex protein RnfC